MGGRIRRSVERMRPFARSLASTLCFGIAGLIWSMPSLRARRLRRAASCTVCAFHHRVRGIAVFVVAALLVAGAGARVQEALSPQIVCHSHITADGQIKPEPRLQISPPSPWSITRNFLVAPISGVGVLIGRSLEMESCSGPSLWVMFWPPPRTSGGGTMFGDVFVAWMPPVAPSGPLSVNGYGITDEGQYVRYGPNMSQTRAEEEGLARHESRHVDQWAAGNLLAGPFAFPAAYIIDGALFPSSRNHFERAAGLSNGVYPPAPDNWPAPRWPDTAAIVIIALLVFRRRLRWLTRVAIGGRLHTRAHAPMRCPVHTRGWSQPVGPPPVPSPPAG
jgi:hypothetical protein